SIVMPNHIHGIIEILYPSEKRNSPSEIGKFKSPSQTIGAIIRGFKIATIKKIKEEINKRESDSSTRELEKGKSNSSTGELQFALNESSQEDSALNESSQEQFAPKESSPDEFAPTDSAPN